MTANRATESWVIVVTVLCWVASVLVIYDPLAPHPFDVLDFSEFLPFLRQEGSFVTKLSSFQEYYALRGRANVATYATYIINHSLWGENPVGWQLSRVVQFGAASVLLFVALRRFGASSIAAGVASLLPVCSQSASHAWLRTSASEPVGLALFLAMTLVALDFNRSARTGARILLLCLLQVLTIAFKEMFAALIPCIWAIALLRDDEGRWRFSGMRRAHWQLIGATSLVTTACAVPILAIALGAPSDSYASLYSATAIRADDALFSYVAGLLPFLVGDGVLYAYAAFYLLLATGWRWFRQSRNPPAQADVILVLLLALPMLGVISYLPWPNYNYFYALPYLFSPAALLALSLTGFAARGRVATAAGLLLGAVPMSFMMTSAHGESRRSIAEVEVAHEIMRRTSAQPTGDTVLFARATAIQREWFGFGATLSRQAAADGLPFPVTREIVCDSARALLRRAAPVTLVVRQSHCGSLGDPDESVTRRFRRFNLGKLRAVDDSARADIFRIG